MEGTGEQGVGVMEDKFHVPPPLSYLSAHETDSPNLATVHLLYLSHYDHRKPSVIFFQSEAVCSVYMCHQIIKRTIDRNTTFDGATRNCINCNCFL